MHLKLYELTSLNEISLFETLKFNNATVLMMLEGIREVDIWSSEDHKDERFIWEIDLLR